MMLRNALYRMFSKKKMETSGNMNTERQFVEKGDSSQSERRKSESVENPQRAAPTIDVLDNDSLLSIFSYLSIKELIKIERVSKRWRDLSLESWKKIKKIDVTDLLEDVRTTLSVDLLKQLLKRGGLHVTHLYVDLLMSDTDIKVNELTQCISKYCPNVKYLNDNDISKIIHQQIQITKLQQKNNLSLYIQLCGVRNIFSSKTEVNYYESKSLEGISNNCLYTQYECKKSLKSLTSQLEMVLKISEGAEEGVLSEKHVTFAQPSIWVRNRQIRGNSRVFLYELNNGSWGILFRDSTKLILLADMMNVFYVHKDGREECFTVNDCPTKVKNKMKLLTDVRRRSLPPATALDISNFLAGMFGPKRIPYLYQWFKTSQGDFMFLTDGTVQVNLKDQAHVILCPSLGTVTYRDRSRMFRTYRFSAIKNRRCNKRLLHALQYVYQTLNINFNLYLLENSVADVA